MSATYVLAPRAALSAVHLEAMHRLRARVFHDRLRWSVEVVDGAERDRFDDAAAYYLIMLRGEVVCGCWRLLPTAHPYMLEREFRQLLDGRPAPRRPEIWELSRFAVDENDCARGPGAFSESALGAMEAVIDFALRRGITRYLTVTTLAMERMLRRTGLALARMGTVRRIGAELTVALDIPVTAATAATVALARARAGRP